MLRALGGLGFEPAAFLLLGEIGLRDGNRARDEQNHRQRQREKANRRRQAVKRGARAAMAAGRFLLRFNRQGADGAPRDGRPFRQSVVGKTRGLRRPSAPNRRAGNGGLQQRIHLSVRLLDGTVGINDGVCAADLFIRRHLRINAALGLLAAQPVALEKALNLRFPRRADDPDGIEHGFHSALEQQRNVADDDLPRRVEAVELTPDFRKDHRVENGIERFALLRVGKDELAELCAVERRAGKHVVAERPADFGQRRAAVGSQRAGNRIRIDDETPLLPEILADGAFSAGDGTGQTDFHRCPPRGGVRWERWGFAPSPTGNPRFPDFPHK